MVLGNRGILIPGGSDVGNRGIPVPRGTQALSGAGNTGAGPRGSRGGIESFHYLGMGSTGKAAPGRYPGSNRNQSNGKLPEFGATDFPGNSPGSRTPHPTSRGNSPGCPAARRIHRAIARGIPPGLRKPRPGPIGIPPAITQPGNRPVTSPGNSGAEAGFPFFLPFLLSGIFDITLKCADPGSQKNDRQSGNRARPRD